MFIFKKMCKNGQLDMDLIKIMTQDITNVEIVSEFHNNTPDKAWTELVYPKSGNTILHVCSELGADAVTLYILENWPPLAPDVRNMHGKTPLHVAAQYSHYKIVEMLLNHGAEVDALKKADWTPLMLACTKTGDDSLRTIQYLINAEASLNFLNKDGWSALHLACRAGDLGIFKFLLNHWKESVVFRTNNGRTLLHIACLHGNIDIVQYLLDYKHPLDLQDDCGNTPFMEAVCTRNVNLARILIKHDANYKISNFVGFTCIHLVASLGHLQMIAYLIKDLQMDPNSKTDKGFTPLHCAARAKKSEAMTLLCDLGADSACVDTYGRTAQYYFDLS